MYHEISPDTVINYASEFSRATRIDLNTDEYHYTTPFFEKDKFLIEIEVNYLHYLNDYIFQFHAMNLLIEFNA